MSRTSFSAMYFVAKSCESEFAAAPADENWINLKDKFGFRNLVSFLFLYKYVLNLKTLEH
jgi:hypothetical protein